MLRTVSGSKTILCSVVYPVIARRGLEPQACFGGCPEDGGSGGEKGELTRDRGVGRKVAVEVHTPSDWCLWSQPHRDKGLGRQSVKAEQVSYRGPTLAVGGEQPSALQQDSHHWGWGNLSGFQPRLALAIPASGGSALSGTVLLLWL